MPSVCILIPGPDTEAVKLALESVTAVIKT